MARILSKTTGEREKSRSPFNLGLTFWVGRVLISHMTELDKAMRNLVGIDHINEIVNSARKLIQFMDTHVIHSEGDMQEVNMCLTSCVFYVNQKAFNEAKSELMTAQNILDKYI